MSAASPRILTVTFVVAAVILLAAAIGLRPAIAALDDHYTKQPIDLRRPLESLGETTLPSFRPAADESGWQSIGDPGALDKLTRIFEVHPERPPAGINDTLLLFVTYYSDPRDRVGHTPEVCYRQDGAVVDGISARTVMVAGIEDEPIPVEMRVLDLTLRGQRMVVSYVFCCNGRFFNDREKVRMAIGWPGDQYVYFSKIETSIPCLRDEKFEASAELGCRLIAEALPRLLADHLPSREEVRGR